MLDFDYLNNDVLRYRHLESRLSESIRGVVLVFIEITKPSVNQRRRFTVSTGLPNPVLTLPRSLYNDARRRGRSSYLALTAGFSAACRRLSPTAEHARRRNRVRLAGRRQLAHAHLW